MYFRVSVNILELFGWQLSKYPCHRYLDVCNRLKIRSFHYFFLVHDICLNTTKKKTNTTDLKHPLAEDHCTCGFLDTITRFNDPRIHRPNTRHFKKRFFPRLTGFNTKLNRVPLLDITSLHFCRGISHTPKNHLNNMTHLAN